MHTEFGSKQLVMLKDGYTHVQIISWDNFNEGTHLKQSVEAYKEIYGCYPQKVSADAISSKPLRTYSLAMTQTGEIFLTSILLTSSLV